MKFEGGLNDHSQSGAMNRGGDFSAARDLMVGNDANMDSQIDSSQSVGMTKAEAMSAVFKAAMNNPEADFSTWQSKYQVGFTELAVGSAERQGLSMEELAGRLEGEGGGKILEQYEQKLESQGVDLRGGKPGHGLAN